MVKNTDPKVFKVKKVKNEKDEEQLVIRLSLIHISEPTRPY